MSNRAFDCLGEPDLAIAGLQLWVTGCDNEGWLYIFCTCKAPGSSVKISGHLLHVDQIIFFLAHLKKLDHDIKGLAKLYEIERNLGLEMTMDNLGNGEMVVQITSDPQTQRHEFRFSVDQTYVRPMIRSLEKILRRFPTASTG